MYDVEKLFNPFQPFTNGYYPEKSYDDCVCDTHFVEWCNERDIRHKSIFHFGAGNLHEVGQGCTIKELENEVLAITVSTVEYITYMKLICSDPCLSKYYRCIFANIYGLSPKALPNFDIITLFHIFEYIKFQKKEYLRYDDDNLINMLLSKLNMNGSVCVFNKSNAIKKARERLKYLEAQKIIEKIETYKTIDIYNKIGEI